MQNYDYHFLPRATNSSCGGGVGCRVRREMRTEPTWEPELSILSQMLAIRVVCVFLISRKLNLTLPHCGGGSASRFAQTPWPMYFIQLICLSDRRNNCSR